MSINLKEAVDFLLSSGYVYWHGKKLKLHTKFYVDLEAGVGGEPPKNWIDRYTSFIIDAGIPARAEAKNGDYYALNKYSQPGMLAFRKAIEGERVNEQWLLESTRLYYKSGIRLKVGVGRYFHEGLWRSDYQAYAASLETGTTQDHVNKETSNGTHSAWQLG